MSGYMPKILEEGLEAGAEQIKFTYLICKSKLTGLAGEGQK